MSPYDLEVLAGWNVAAKAIAEYGLNYAKVILWNRARTLDQVSFVSGQRRAAEFALLAEEVPEMLTSIV
jgi:hypothetical protein